MSKKILYALEKPEKAGAYATPDYMFFCPGCEFGHAVWVTQQNSVGASWTFNGDMERPTFEPSLLITWNRPDKKAVCHSFVRNGQIQFLSDCTHKLAGQTVALPEF